MFSQNFWCFTALMVHLGTIRVYANMRDDVKECVKEVGMTLEEFWAAKKSNNVDAVDPCLIACFFKKVGVIDSKGMYDSNKAIEFHGARVTSPEIKESFEKAKKECVSVNDEKVSDGEKGCERAKLLFKCFQKSRHDIIVENED